MAITLSSSTLVVKPVCGPSSNAGPSSRSSPAASPAPFVSQFAGSKIARAAPRVAQLQPQQALFRKISAAVAVDTIPEQYTLPSWSKFEMGRYPVYWETGTGRPPASGEPLTIYFNPAASNLQPDAEYGIGFNGGFNQPVMCSGEPRVMTRKERGLKCDALYTIKMNVPVHALTIVFSFTDGTNWTQSYTLTLEVPKKLKNKPVEYVNEELAKELSADGACARVIFPDAVLFQDRCAIAGLYHDGGDRCELDLVPGCTDPGNPFFNPLANYDDGSCLLLSDDEK